MPSPVYSAGTPGNVFVNAALTSGKNIAVFADLSTDVESHLTFDFFTAGGTAPAAQTVVFGVYNSQAGTGTSPFAPITLSGSASTVSIPVNSSASIAGIHNGTTFALINHTTGVGELVTMSTTGPSGTGAQTLTLANAPAGTYGTGDLIYLIAQTPDFAPSPANPSTGAVAINSAYGVKLAIGPGQYIISATNGSAQTVGVQATVDKITSIV